MLSLGNLRGGGSIVGRVDEHLMDVVDFVPMSQ